MDFGDSDVSFTDATFAKENIWFTGASFGDGNVFFDGANFGDGEVWFNEVSFGDGYISFARAKFGDGFLSFDRADFGGGEISFSRAAFGKGDVSFTGATIAGNAIFVDLDFRSTALDASGMRVAGNLYVRSSFLQSIDFSLIDVKGTASFSGSSFAKVPDFRDAKFDRPPEVAGMVLPRPKLGWSTLATDPNDVAKYRKLKAMALAANDHERDGEFFACEMLAKRGTETNGFFGLLFNTIYWWFGDFGQSFVRPLIWLAVSFSIFAACCFWMLGGALSLIDRLWFAADFSFRNALPLFGSLFRFAQTPQNYIPWYQETYNCLDESGVDIDGLITLGIIESMFGTVLLFLLLLALRNRFRLK